jgi:hypothetical protein
MSGDTNLPTQYYLVTNPRSFQLILPERIAMSRPTVDPCPIWVKLSIFVPAPMTVFANRCPIDRRSRPDLNVIFQNPRFLSVESCTTICPAVERNRIRPLR